MPNVPGWFQATDYFYNKLAQMQAQQEAGAEYTAQNLLDAFNAAGFTVSGLEAAQLNASGEQLYRHFNEWGNAENVSPNNYFDVAAYRTNKIAQVIADGQPVPAGFSSWTPEAMDAAMEAAGLSYWDHYTQWGTAEGINPSAAFDTDEYLKLKADQLNKVPLEDRQPLPDGTQGEWTPALVAEAFKNADLNAVEHYMLYNTSEGIGYVPGPENPAVTVNLTTDQDIYPAAAISTDYVATVTANPSTTTLNPNDQITGGNRGDQLTVNMDSFWMGMNQDGFVNGVPVININNTADNRDLFFNANNIEGAKTYNVDGNVNLNNLNEAGIAVNLSNVDTPTGIDIEFTTEAIAGSNDALTLGLNNVRVPTTLDNGKIGYDPVNITSMNIEALTVNSTGNVQNVANLTGVQHAKAIVFTGDGDVKIRGVEANTNGVGSNVTSLDGSAATGDLDINATNNQVFTSIAMGTGKDKVEVNQLLANATITDAGGVGDELVLNNTSEALALNMSGVETLTAKNIFGPLTLSGAAISGLETLKMVNTANAADGANPGGSISLTNFNQPQLNVQAEKHNSADLTIQDIASVNINVGDGNVDTNDSYTGTVTLGNTRTVSVGVEQADNAHTAIFAGKLIANEASQVNLTSAQGSGINLQSGSSLADASQVIINGYGQVQLQNASIGTDAKYVTVNAQGLYGQNSILTANFSGNNNYKVSSDGVITGATLNFTGSSTGANNVTVDSSYTTVVANTGLGNDKLTLTANASRPFSTSNLNANLGAGTNTVYVNGDIATFSQPGAIWDFSGLSGATDFVFKDITSTEDLAALQALINAASATSQANQIRLPGYTTGADWTTGDNVNPPSGGGDEPTGDEVTGVDDGSPVTNYNGTGEDETFTVNITSAEGTSPNVTAGGAGGVDTFVGTVDNAGETFTMRGGVTGAVVVDFGSEDTTKQLDVIKASQIVVNTGEADGAKVTGTLTAPTTITAESSSAVIGTTATPLIAGAASATIDTTKITEDSQVVINVVDGTGPTVTINGGSELANVKADGYNGNLILSSTAATVNANVSSGDGTTLTVNANDGDGNDQEVILAASGAVVKGTINGGEGNTTTISGSFTGGTGDLIIKAGTGGAINIEDGALTLGTTKSVQITGDTGNDEITLTAKSDVVVTETAGGDNTIDLSVVAGNTATITDGAVGTPATGKDVFSITATASDKATDQLTVKGVYNNDTTDSSLTIDGGEAALNVNFNGAGLNIVASKSTTITGGTGSDTLAGTITKAMNLANNTIDMKGGDDTVNLTIDATMTDGFTLKVGDNEGSLSNQIKISQDAAAGTITIDGGAGGSDVELTLANSTTKADLTVFAADVTSGEGKDTIGLQGDAEAAGQFLLSKVDLTETTSVEDIVNITAPSTGGTFVEITGFAAGTDVLNGVSGTDVGAGSNWTKAELGYVLEAFGVDITGGVDYITDGTNGQLKVGSTAYILNVGAIADNVADTDAVAANYKGAVLVQLNGVAVSGEIDLNGSAA